MVERALRMCKVAGSMPAFSIVIIFKCNYLFRISSFLLSYFSLFFTNFFHLHFFNSGMYFGIFTSKVKENFSGISCIRSQIYIFINYEIVILGFFFPFTWPVSMGFRKNNVGCVFHALSPQKDCIQAWFEQIQLWWPGIKDKSKSCKNADKKC